jgi:hypothetical protein
MAEISSFVGLWGCDNSRAHYKSSDDVPSRFNAL